MDSQLEQIGARCHFCSRQDFLPFQCKQCTHFFCITHSPPSSHACPAAATTTAAAASTEPRGPREHQPSLRDLQNEHLARRQPVVQKSSSKPLTGTQKSALETLKASLSSKFVLRGSSSTVAMEKRDIQRLKMSAKGEASVPVEDRLYIYISTRGHDQTGYWVNKTWSVGRSLDAIAKKFGVVNENARTQDESRRLHLLCKELVLEPSQVIGRRVEDGQHVILFRGMRPIT